jgi:hypothetical protein
MFGDARAEAEWREAVHEPSGHHRPVAVFDKFNNLVPIDITDVET